MQHRRVAGQPLPVVRQQPVVERRQLLPGGRGAAPQTPAQRRIGYQTPAYHHRIHLRILAAECRHIRRREQVAVVHRHILSLCQRRVEGVPVYRAPIEFLLQPRVDDQLRDGIPGVDVQQPRPLRRIVLSDAGLDGHPHLRQRPEDLVQTPLQLLRIGQQPRPLVLGGDSAGGTAQIEIDLPVSHGVQLPGRPHKVVAPVGQQLRHGVPLPLRHLVQLLALEGQVAVGGEKRREILVHAAEHLPLGAAPDIAGQPLHGRGV